MLRLGPSRPRPALAPIATEHEAADALPLDGVELGHQFGIERDAFLVEQRHPVFFVGLGMQNAHRIGVLFRSVVGHVECAEDCFLGLQPFPRDQGGRAE